MVRGRVNAPAGRIGSCMIAVAAGLTFAATAEAAVTFEGQMVRVTEEFAGFPDSTADVTVGSGPELQGFGVLDFDVNIEADSIELIANQTIPGGGGLFGFGFADINASISRIVSVIIGSQGGLFGLDPTNVGIVENGDKIVVDFGGVAIGQGDFLRLDVTFQETPSGVIPLPATLPLVFGGIAALAAVGRRRKS